MAHSNKVRNVLWRGKRWTGKKRKNSAKSRANLLAAQNSRGFEHLEDRCLLSLVGGLDPAALYLPQQRYLFTSQG